MTLPAVTFCISSFPNFDTNLTLDQTLFECIIDGIKCDHNDFFPFEIKTNWLNKSINSVDLKCYVLNGGRNSSGHSTDVKSTKDTGFYSGIGAYFFLPKDHFIHYYINDAFVRPTRDEISSNLLILPGNSAMIKLEKTIETKLEFPYSDCRNSIPNSFFKREFQNLNLTYRRVNCLELCLVNVGQNCEELCPLECKSISYSPMEKSVNIGYFSSLLNKTGNYEFLKAKLSMRNQTEIEIYTSVCSVSMFYDDLKYNQITQTPKTSPSALISNLGGTLGLFLELSFLSLYKLLRFFMKFF
jgi:hypothetical protein